MAFEFVQFVLRNPLYSAKNVRSWSKVRKAMVKYRSEYPTCEWCGRDGKLDVHHIIPVSVRPDMAHELHNMMMLCRKPPCHQIIGHDGDFGGRYLNNARDLCRDAKVTKVVRSVKNG